MIRKTVSLVALFSFIFMLVSSVVLYIIPEGRVAYWANWNALLLDKPQWTNVHITIGTLFVITGIWHAILNRKALILGMKKTIGENLKTPLPLLISLILTLFVFFGTLLSVQPMQQLVNWNAQIKTYQSNRLGSPPFAHAEQATVGKFCQMLQLDVNKAIAQLQASNLNGKLTKDTTLLEIANANNITPQQVYLIMRQSASDADPFSMLPPTSPEGTGKRKLQDFAAEFGLPIEAIIKKLSAQGITASPDETFHQIADKQGISPREVYQALRTAK